LQTEFPDIMYSHSFEVVTSGETRVKERGLKDRDPFTQMVVQQATYVRLQGVAVIVSLNTVNLTDRLDGCRFLRN